MKYIAVDFTLPKIPFGSKIKFVEEKQKYTIMASNACFLICNKPFNAKKTVLYTIVDRKEKIRGVESLIFGFGAKTKKECEEMLERLTEGTTQISQRNRIKLNVEKYYIIKK